MPRPEPRKFDFLVLGGSQALVLINTQFNVKNIFYFFLLSKLSLLLATQSGSKDPEALEALVLSRNLLEMQIHSSHHRTLVFDKIPK